MNEYVTALRQQPGVDNTASPHKPPQWCPDTGVNKTHSTRSLRREFAKTYAWGIPNKDAIQELTAHTPLIEVGAGNGYWAYTVQQGGGDIISTDPDPPPHTWTTVHEATHEVISEHQDRTLFLCWPTFNADWPAEAIDLYTGDTLVYVGEPCGGITGTRDMHRAISETFGLAETVVSIPRWGTNSDNLYVFTR